MRDIELDIKRLIFDHLPGSDDDGNIITARRIRDNRLFLGYSNVQKDTHQKYEVVLRPVEEEDEA